MLIEFILNVTWFVLVLLLLQFISVCFSLFVTVLVVAWIDCSGKEYRRYWNRSSNTQTCPSQSTAFLRKQRPQWWRKRCVDDWWKCLFIVICSLCTFLYHSRRIYGRDDNLFSVGKKKLFYRWHGNKCSFFTSKSTESLLTSVRRWQKGHICTDYPLCVCACAIKHFQLIWQDKGYFQNMLI